MINSLLFYLLGTILRAAILYLFYKTVIGVAKTRMAAVVQKRLAIAAIILLDQ